MDYSKYYLKNYRPDDEGEAGGEPAYSGPLLDRPHTPEIVYINPDGEEFVPDPPREARPAPRKSADKKPFGVRLIINVLIALVVILSIFVSVDFITDGQLIEAVTELFSQTRTYYAVLDLPSDTVQGTVVNAETVRLGGKAGYPIKYDGSYYCVLDIYGDRKSADNAGASANSVIYEFSCSAPDLPSEYDAYLDKPYEVCDNLDDIAAKLASGEMSSSQALLSVEELYEQTLIESDELKALSNERATKQILEFVSDYSVAVAALASLCDESVYRTNYASDVRYARCQILFAFAL